MKKMILFLLLSSVCPAYSMEDLEQPAMQEDLQSHETFLSQCKKKCTLSNGVKVGLTLGAVAVLAVGCHYIVSGCSDLTNACDTMQQELAGARTEITQARIHIRGLNDQLDGLNDQLANAREELEFTQNALEIMARNCPAVLLESLKKIFGN